MEILLPERTKATLEYATESCVRTNLAVLEQRGD
jgi:hypothetical protein